MDWLLHWLEEHAFSLMAAGASGAIMAGFRVGRYFGDVNKKLDTMNDKLTALDVDVREGRLARGKIHDELDRVARDVAWVRGRCGGLACHRPPADQDDDL